MTALITEAGKALINAAFNDLHDTFARDITIYKLEGKLLISSGLDANPIYGRIQDQKTSKPQTVAYTGRARIKYEGNQGANSGMIDGAGGKATDNAIGLATPAGMIRLKVDETAYNIIKSAQTIEVDGKPYEVVSDAARPGPFSPVFFTVYLKLVV